MSEGYDFRSRSSVNAAQAATQLRGRHVAAAFSIAVAGAFSLAPLVASAARLDYFALFGEWSVICSADEAARERTCAIEAPPLDLDRPRNAIELTRAEDGEPEIVIRRRAMVNAATPVFLRIDSHPAHKATPTPSGEVLWPAAEAIRIIEELKGGTEMVLRTFTGSDNRPRDEFISLNGFEQAWEAYRLQSAPSGLPAEN